MADTSVTVNTASGTAPVDTRTQPDGDHRQAMVLGDATATATAAVDADGHLSTRGAVSSTGVVLPVVLTASSSAVLLPADPGRLFGSIYNPLDADLLVALDDTASATSYTVIVPPLGYFELPLTYTGPAAGYTTGSGTVYATAVN
jgi:hypothetical protein